MKMTGIYRIYNKANDKSYIGQAIDIDIRWNGHIRELREGCHHNTLLQRDWDKYGEESFEFLVLSKCNPIELNAMEKLYIDIYNCTNVGYNIAEGNRAVSKKYKEELLTKDKKEVKIESKAINKEQEYNVKKIDIDKQRQLIKDDIKENLDIKIINDETFTVDADFFDIYLKIREVSDMMPDYGQLGCKEYLSCTLYSEIWEVIGESVGENYSYILEIDGSNIKISPSYSIIENEMNYKYLSYLRVGDRYYLSKTYKRDMNRNYKIEGEKLRRPRENKGIKQNHRLTITRMDCPLLKGLLWIRSYIKNNCPKYYEFKLKELEEVIDTLIIKTDKYFFKGKLVCIIDNLYIISKTYMEDEYFILDLSTSIVNDDVYTFMLENWQEIADIKFKLKPNWILYKDNRGLEMEVIDNNY